MINMFHNNVGTVIIGSRLVQDSFCSMPAVKSIALHFFHIMQLCSLFNCAPCLTRLTL